MKNSKFVAIIIAVFAPIVKLFPSLAMKFTKRSNRFAEKFQLSAIAEESYLLKHPQSEVWVGERIWHLQTRKYMFGLRDTRPELFEAFINNINNGIIFDAAYEIVPEEAIKAKAYTLDAERVIKVCNDNVNYLYILVNKQPQSFTVEVVKKFNKEAKETFFYYLFTNIKWKELAAFDQLLFNDMKKNENFKSYMVFLLSQKYYEPNLSAEQLSSLEIDFENWCQNGNPLIVAEKMVAYWKEKKIFQHLFKLLGRLLHLPVSQCQKDMAFEILNSLRTSEFYAKSVIALVSYGFACPQDFGVLLDGDQSNLWVEKNLDLCITQNVKERISFEDSERFDEAQKEKLLVALAQEDCLSLWRLSKISNAKLKQKLLDVLEERAQLKWFQSILDQGPKKDNLHILENCQKTGKIYGAVQSFTFKDDKWVHVFVEHNWYDTKHQLQLMQSRFSDSIINFIQKYGITQTLFEALLVGPCSYLAPKAKLYLEKEKDSSFEDRI